MCEEVYTLTKTWDGESTTIQFLVKDNEELLYVGDDGEPTEILQQSGWSFQDEFYQKMYSEFIEEVKQLDLLEWSDGMTVGETSPISDSITITREG